MTPNIQDKHHGPSDPACIAEALWQRFVDQHLRAHNARGPDDEALVEGLNLRMVILLYCSLPSVGEEMTGRKAIMHAAVTELDDPEYDRVAAMIEAAIDVDMATPST